MRHASAACMGREETEHGWAEEKCCGEHPPHLLRRSWDSVLERRPASAKKTDDDGLPKFNE